MTLSSLGDDSIRIQDYQIERLSSLRLLNWRPRCHKYLLDIEVTCSDEAIYISKCKYALVMLEKVGTLRVKLVDNPIVSNFQISTRIREPLGDLRIYKRLVET